MDFALNPPCFLLFILFSLNYIRLPKIAYRAKCLQVFQQCLAALTPRDYVVDMKLDPGCERWTPAARATSEAVTLKHVPAKAERWITASCSAESFWARLNSGWLGARAVSVFNECFKRCRPRAKTAVVWGLRNRGRR